LYTEVGEMRRSQSIKESEKTPLMRKVEYGILGGAKCRNGFKDMNEMLLEGQGK
jgi:hypothetical protein